MTDTSLSPRSAKNARKDRGDATRQKLLLASVEVFGRLGFDAATTRALADAAGVNLQAITYYFSDKEGLYVATADYIADLIGKHMSNIGERLRLRFREAEESGVPIKIDEARSLLVEVVQHLAALFVSRESDLWARFMVREMIEPTEAFKRIYGRTMGPGMRIAGRLIAIIMAEPPDSERIRLHTLSLVGTVLMFRMARATAMAHLGWKRIGQREAQAVHDMVPEFVAAICPQGPVE
ncbi:CerR family C-terminal domain-containing protein [Hyphomicrobium sp.]|mgnify:CR=1 FL=1|uniref:CerR family C-terminal domain-containing protein n=1 Tax=Hyphomicrobium sp. TaxID=82 RepID=UPI002FE2D4DE